MPVPLSASSSQTGTSLHHRAFREPSIREAGGVDRTFTPVAIRKELKRRQESQAEAMQTHHSFPFGREKESERDSEARHHGKERKGHHKLQEGQQKPWQCGGPSLRPTARASRSYNHHEHARQRDSAVVDLPWRNEEPPIRTRSTTVRVSVKQEAVENETRVSSLTGRGYQVTVSAHNDDEYFPPSSNKMIGSYCHFRRRR